MNTLERAAVAALPWLSAAVAYAVAARPLAARHAAGWWTLYLATVIQPVFAAIDLARDEPRWGSPPVPRTH